MPGWFIIIYLIESLDAPDISFVATNRTILWGDSIVGQQSKVKLLFWVHIQAQRSALQTLTNISLIIGPLQSIYPIGYLNSLGSIQPLTRNLATRLSNLLSQVPICSWVERSNAAWNALLKDTTNRRTGMVLKSGLDLDPNPEPCTLPLDQLATQQSLLCANAYWGWWLYC